MSRARFTPAQIAALTVVIDTYESENLIRFQQWWDPPAFKKVRDRIQLCREAIAIATAELENEAAERELAREEDDDDADDTDRYFDDERTEAELEVDEQRDAEILEREGLEREQ